MEVTLTRADATQLVVVKHFFLAFFYDLSEYDDNLVINDYGLPTWKPAGLPGPTNFEEFIKINWWIRGEGEQYVIRADGNPAGYLIIVKDKANLTAGVDYELLDFYIAPKYRRQGIGRIAARAAFDLHHGRWQVFELERNQRARTFWQAIISDYTGGNYENLDGGTQQQFNN